MDFLAEHDFDLGYRSGASNRAAEFLSCINYEEPSADDCDGRGTCNDSYESQSDEYKELECSRKNHDDEEDHKIEELLNTITMKDPRIIVLFAFDPWLQKAARFLYRNQIKNKISKKRALAGDLLYACSGKHDYIGV